MATVKCAFGKRGRVIPNDEMMKMIRNYEGPDRIETLKWDNIYIVHNNNNIFSEMEEWF